MESDEHELQGRLEEFGFTGEKAAEIAASVEEAGAKLRTLVERLTALADELQARRDGEAEAEPAPVS